MEDKNTQNQDTDAGDRALDIQQGREQSWRDGSMLGSPFTTLGNNYE